MFLDKESNYKPVKGATIEFLSVGPWAIGFHLRKATRSTASASSCYLRNKKRFRFRMKLKKKQTESITEKRKHHVDVKPERENTWCYLHYAVRANVRHDDPAVLSDKGLCERCDGFIIVSVSKQPIVPSEII